jgi:YhcH/YjgK/YiaL family protein
MILDRLEQADRYLDLQPGFAAAFAFLRRPDLAQLAVGRYDIDGDRVYALVQRAAGRQPEAGRLEAHRRYIDIQFVIAGADTMGWRSTPTCRQVDAAYDPAKDAELYADTPDAWLAVGPGSFAIFFPEDAHLPLIGEGDIHKVVVKVARQA